MRSLFDDKRHYDFAARFCVLGNQRRRQFCTEGAHACKPLVFFVYVAAHRTERRHDQPEDSGKIEADSSRKSSGRRTKSRRSAGLYGLSRLHALCAACRWLRLRTLCVYFAWRMALPHLAARVLFPRYGKRLCAFLHRLHRNHRAVCSGGALRCKARAVEEVKKGREWCKMPITLSRSYFLSFATGEPLLGKTWTGRCGVSPQRGDRHRTERDRLNGVPVARDFANARLA